MSSNVAQVVYYGGEVHEQEIEVLRKVKYLVEEEQRDIDETHIWGVSKIVNLKLL